MNDNAKINWKNVYEAQKRGKKGIMIPGDQELCERAWKLNPGRYAQQAKSVFEECFSEINPLAPQKE